MFVIGDLSPGGLVCVTQCKSICYTIPHHLHNSITINFIATANEYEWWEFKSRLGKVEKKIGWIEPSKMSVVAILLNGEEGETIKKCILGSKKYIIHSLSSPLHRILTGYTTL